MLVFTSDSRFDASERTVANITLSSIFHGTLHDNQMYHKSSLDHDRNLKNKTTLEFSTHDWLQH